MTLPEAPEEDDGCESSCPATGGGPTLVRLPDNYCIDSTEVTRGQYQEWLDTDPAIDGQSDTCDWNVSYGPDPGCLKLDPAENWEDWDHPAVCVDWCDAHAYCNAMGKRLCGRIRGGSVPWDEYRDIEVSQWHNACVSGPAQLVYPYGLAYKWERCNGLDYGVFASLPVGSLETCQSTVPEYGGVYDLSGNVWEWVDSCGGGSCRIRGGSFARSNALSCHFDKSLYPYDVDSHVGFRCCSQAQ